MTAPAPDQVEVTIFGPGFGECIVAHLGAGNWIIIDSCIDSRSGQPAALNYLQELKVDLANVVLVIATHWHDDHIRGMSRQLKAFERARFCTSPALTHNEFVATILQYDNRHGIVAGSGASELCGVLELLRMRAEATTPIRSSPGRPIYILPKEQSGHGHEVRVTTLSPSDKQFQKFLVSLADWAPIPLAAKKRVPDQDQNDLSVATIITVGDQALLLGADLKESGDKELGWSAVLGIEGLPKHVACVFKVPHHGSKNGNCDDVWAKMLIANPIAVVTPWNKNKGLPTSSDVERLQSKTHSGFITSLKSRLPTRERPYSVDKQIRETVGKLRSAQEETGFVTLRNGGAKNPKMWCVTLSENAAPLRDWRAA